MNSANHCLFSLFAVIALASCASPSKAPLASDANPQGEIDRTSAAIEDASRKQYDRLAPKNFDRAVDFRNSAAEKMKKGREKSQALDDIAVAERSIEVVQRVGDANSTNLHPVLDARRYAMEAQAPQFQEKKFRSADNELRDIGREIEQGSYKLDAEQLAKLEKRFGTAEIEARKHAELGSIKLMLKEAKSDDAKKKTPLLFEIASAKIASAEHAIEISPHNSASYAPAVNEAKQAAQKLTDVLAIARRNNASEEVALALWNQNRQLEASRAELTKANLQAASTQEKLEADLAAKDTKLDSQHESINALKSQNNQYASEEELKQKIEEIKKTFSPEEAEVMKDGKKLIVRLKKIQFSSGRFDVNPESFATLRKVDALIAAVPAKQITVEGHTDSTGSNVKNKNLSEKRAESVKKYLVSQGLPEELQVETAGFGSDRPLTTNKTKNGRAINRRVDIVIETPVVL